VLRVQANDLRPIPFGRSSELRLGDDLLAIGFPLGLGGPTVTRGIVSGLNRTISPEDGPTLEGLLQTDAAINPGNSGGALVDSAGRLIGINTAAASAGAAENVGFAIAIDEARPVIDEIRSKPPDRRAWLGVAVGSVSTDEDAAQLGLDPSTRGAVIVSVVPTGPAAKAGLHEGDVITSVDGKAIGSASDLTKALSKLDPGDQVTVEVVDPLGPRRATLKLARRPATIG
jgi:putative serine protease PepD